MYNPKTFKIEDKTKIIEFIMKYNFGVISSIDRSNEKIVSSHIPFLIERTDDGQEQLLCHFAKANPHWNLIEQNPKVQIIFFGPHAYISPKYYINTSVPTWNYTTVHLTGKAQIISKSNDKLEIIEKLVSIHEDNQDGWDLSYLDSSFIATKMNAIIVVKITDLTFEAKFKLNQNKKEEDIERVIAQLIANGGTDKDCGLFMKHELLGK